MYLQIEEATASFTERTRKKTIHLAEAEKDEWKKTKDMVFDSAEGL